MQNIFMRLVLPQVNTWLSVLTFLSRLTKFGVLFLRVIMEATLDIFNAPRKTHKK